MIFDTHRTPNTSTGAVMIKQHKIIFPITHTQRRE